MKHILFIDRDCGFCVWVTQRIKEWDRHNHLQIVSIQSHRGLLSGMDEQGRLASWHLLTPDEILLSGGRVAPVLFGLLPGGKFLSILTGLCPPLTDRVYELVARNRHRLSRLIGAVTCPVIE